MENQPELLAQHYTEGGLVEKAVAYWGKAGRRSATRPAMAEAVAQLQKGLDQLALLPDTPERQRQELEFCSALGAVFRAVKGPAAPETGQVYARAIDLWERLGSPSDFLHIPYAQSYYDMFRGKFDLARRRDEALLRLSSQRDDAAGLLLAHVSSGRTLALTGRFSLSRSHLEAALRLYDPASHSSLVHQIGIDPQVTAQAYLGIILFCLGYPEQALARTNAAIAEARRLAHPPSLAWCVTLGGVLLTLAGDNAALAEWTEELTAVAAEQGFSFWRVAAICFSGWIKVNKGDVSEGMPLLRSGAAAFRATGAEGWTAHPFGLVATACEIVGQIEEGLTELDNALQIVERTGEGWLTAELYRHKGQLLLCQGHAEAAETFYRQALGIAREQEAKLWELRAAMSLARLLRDQGCRGEARDLLAPVYGWFTEGFETADLKEAKALLDALA
jgi:predicted ATPase